MDQNDLYDLSDEPVQEDFWVEGAPPGRLGTNLIRHWKALARDYVGYARKLAIGALIGFPVLSPSSSCSNSLDYNPNSAYVQVNVQNELSRESKSGELEGNLVLGNQPIRR